LCFQGASIAIEDSFSLAAELIPILKNSNFSAQQTADAFVRFQKSRKSRVQHYQTISRFTALLASPSQSAVETVRDFPLKVTKPGSWLNSAVFDLSLNYSLGQGCWSPPELPTL
jgi:2-polyprenyl-6-methoxyphenol hydroxylase-like FAD-dependent oxidoreductase